MTAPGEDEDGLGVTFGPDQVMKRPDLAIKIARIASAWAVLESNAGSCLGVLMRAEPRAAIAMLSKVQTTTAKSQAIRAVGTAVLPEAELLDLLALLKRFDTLAKRRNAVVHGLWGTTPQWPQHLIWAPSHVTTTTFIALLEHHLAGTADEFLEEQKRQFVVWSAERFDELFEEIKSLISDLIIFVAAQHRATTLSRMGGMDNA